MLNWLSHSSNFSQRCLVKTSLCVVLLWKYYPTVNMVLLKRTDFCFQKQGSRLWHWSWRPSSEQQIWEWLKLFFNSSALIVHQENSGPVPRAFQECGRSFWTWILGCFYVFKKYFANLISPSWTQPGALPCARWVEKKSCSVWTGRKIFSQITCVFTAQR